VGTERDNKKRCDCRGKDSISIELKFLEINLSELKYKIITYYIKILTLLLLFIVVRGIKYAKQSILQDRKSDKIMF
jgi:hypothetical protein